jgi:hypothetical protein
LFFSKQKQICGEVQEGGSKFEANPAKVIKRPKRMGERGSSGKALECDVLSSVPSVEKKKSLKNRKKVKKKKKLNQSQKMP